MRKAELPRIDILAARRPRRRLVWILVSSSAIVAALAWWFLARGTPVTTATVIRGSAAEIVYGTGAVEPVRWARVATLIKGRIVERCRCEGKYIRAGDLLARLDDKEAQAALRELRAREEFERRDVDRQRQLVLQQATPKQLLERAESELLRTQALIAVQMERLEAHRLVAPLDGVVLREDGEVGEVVDSNTVLYRIGSPYPLQIVAAVNEEDVPRVRVGQVALLRSDAFAGRPLSGRVSEITPAGDPVEKTYRIRIALPDDTPLMIGMSVEANIVTQEAKATLLAPAAAVSGGYVYVVEGGRAVPRQVTIGIRGTRDVQILTGLEEGDIIVSHALPSLRANARIRIANT